MSERERFRRIEALFREASGLPASDWRAFAEARCNEPEDRRELLELLAEDESPRLGEPASIGDEWPTMGAATSGKAALPDSIGGFRVRGVLGSGGMGVVYEAEQSNPRRRVALKVLRSGFLDTERRRRFQLEAEVLGRLRHPAIAQIFEAGTSESAHPYFAMELVDGRPLTSWASSGEVTLRRRLDLFIRVCDGVEHAHQHGVIHRDLKPANILVDSNGEPKILDFGIARATDSDVQATTIHTDAGQLVGTIPYMSPEQASGDPTRIDTRSDVYSLGVVLFELLSGTRPHSLDRLALDEAVRIVRTEDPTRLGSVDRRLRGDLETIVGKALEKDVARRYQTVSALSTDLRRYLRNEPVEARPPSAFYQLQKFTRRNRAVVMGLGAVLVVLTAGLVGVSLALREAQIARASSELALNEAQRQARIAGAVNAFLNDDLLGAVDPSVTPDEHEITVREALDLASERIERRFAEEPLVEASVRYTIGATYFSLGEYDQSAPHLERSHALRAEHLGRDDAGTLDALHSWGLTVFYGGDLDGAEPLLTELVERRRRTLGDEDPVTIWSIADLGMLYSDQGRFEDAEPLLTSATEIGVRVLGDEETHVLAAFMSLAALNYRRGDFEEAAELFDRVLEVERRTLGDDSIDTIGTMSNLALALQRLGRYEEAEALTLESIAIHTRVLGAEHPYTQTTRTNLALMYTDLERYEEAEAIFREVLALRVRTLGDTDPETLVSKAMLGRMLRRCGRYEEAEPLNLAAAEGFIEVRGVEHPYTQVAIESLVMLYDLWEKPEQRDRWADLRIERDGE